jgi:RNA polymerase sigma factor (TIGR02999 family)
VVRSSSNKANRRLARGRSVEYYSLRPARVSRRTAVFKSPQALFYEQSASFAQRKSLSWECSLRDPSAAEQLLPLVYDELRKLAAVRLAHEKPGQTLQATALVHEAYLRLVDAERVQNWDSRGHFFAAAAEAMRRILVEQARRKRRLKAGRRSCAGKNLKAVDLAAPASRNIDCWPSTQRLSKLASVDDRAGRLVNSLFAGLTMKEAAETIGDVVSTADQIWAYARTWLLIGPYKLLQQIGEGRHGRRSTWPSRPSPVRARWRSRSSSRAWTAGRSSPASRPTAGAGDDGPRQHRPRARRGRHGQRPALLRDGLVHGVPITKYCDDNHLTPRQRLELFVPVCQAIQHAHQKGIIHRDIKPSNVMVTLYDGKPVPKVIDFGVAKATEQKLTERTLFTQYGTMVGTLEYMSPSRRR